MRIDPRAGSKELVGPLRALWVDVEEVMLDSDEPPPVSPT